MNFGNYWRNGMGLHEYTIEHIFNILKYNNIKNIVEFGSGESTRFLVESRNSLKQNYSIYSFDHHEKYCYQQKHDFLNLQRRDLIKCNDQDYEQLFITKKFDRSKFENAQNEKENFRTRNTFYDIDENDLPELIDLVILDGPSGNGRNISYVHLINKINDNCYMIIDDVDHYDFLERAKQIFKVEVLVHENLPSIHPLFNYAILKVNKK